MQRPILGFLIGLLLVSCLDKTKSGQEKEETTTAVKDTLTLALNDLLAPGYINGFGVAIVNADTTLYSRGFGLSRIQEQLPYTKNTVQNIASVSKTLIGVSLLKAQEMGKLKLNDPIDQYLPFKVVNPKYPEDNITIQHLATHTSSIQDGDTYGEKSYVLENADDVEIAKSLPSSEEFNAPDADMEMGPFLKNFLSSDGAWYSETHYLDQKPGAIFEYSNVGATLAAYIIEQVTEQTYAQFTAQHILEPLGMASTGWTNSDIDTAKRTPLYTLDGKKIPDYKLITYPDGGLITSVDDLAKYLSELISGYSGNGKLLSKDSYELLFSKLLSADNFKVERETDSAFDDEYNSGLFMGHTPKGYIGHTGGDPGVATFLFFDPETEIGKLLFVNTDLDQKGAEQFFAIWNTLGEYEEKLNPKIFE